MTYLIKTGLLWDGVNDHTLPDRVIVVEKERIKTIGHIDEMAAKHHEKILDWSGFTIIPGLIDCHTHLSMDPALENYLDRVSDPVAELTIRAIVMMRKDLAAGVTTCRCCGDREFLDVACKQALIEGLVEGPRLLIAARGIRAAKGQGFMGYPFEGPEQMRTAVRENIDSGADFIKFYITGTLKGEGSIPSFLSREEIRIIIEESHRAGVRTAAHCVGGIGLDWALELGLDSLEHGYHISDVQLDGLSKSNTCMVLTPSPILTESRVMHLPPDLIPGHLEERDMIARRMAAFLATGLPFAVGTDGMHGELARELAYVVQLGGNSLQALRAATIQGAKVCAIEGDTGSLETGKFADIVAVKGNPLEDIGAMARVVHVIKEGQLVYSGEVV